MPNLPHAELPKPFPKTVVMLGTGWNAVLDGVKPQKVISYKELFGVDASVPGHEGKLVIATVKNKRVAFMQGRLHMYEGYTAEEVTLPIRVFAEAGMKRLLVTSAVGALNPKYTVGDFVIVQDLLTLFLALDNPVKGPVFTDMSEVFDEKWRQQAVEACVKLKLPFQQGVHAFYHGPNFETPADKMALRNLGADICGMSMTPEVIMAKALGIKVLGLSLVTNLAFVKHAHKDVLAAANRSSKKMAALIKNVL